MTDRDAEEIPQEVKDLTPLRGTVERLWNSVCETDECTMARSGGYQVVQDDDEMVVFRLAYEDDDDKGVICSHVTELGRWDNE